LGAAEAADFHTRGRVGVLLDALGATVAAERAWSRVGCLRVSWRQPIALAALTPKRAAGADNRELAAESSVPRRASGTLRSPPEAHLGFGLPHGREFTETDNPSRETSSRWSLENRSAC
jgi:hypothetical protein